MQLPCAQSTPTLQALASLWSDRSLLACAMSASNAMSGNLVRHPPRVLESESVLRTDSPSRRGMSTDIVLSP